MKGKKLLLPVAFVLLVFVLVLGITGLAVAAPATVVKGTVERDVPPVVVGGSEPDPMTGDYWIEVYETLVMKGDLEGSYVEHFFMYGNIYSPYFTCVGDATFTLKGESVPDWTAELYSTGELDPSDWVGAKGHTKDTLTEGMKGQITFHWSEGGYGPRADYYTYTGVLK
jgi:hypothetical protein